MSNETINPFAPLAGEQFLVLTTYRQSGEGVPTTVWFAEKDGKLYITTHQSTGKAKRIRNNPNVTLTASDARGATHGPTIHAQARMLSTEEYPLAEGALQGKYGERFEQILARQGSEAEIGRTYIEVSPEQ